MVFSLAGRALAATQANVHAAVKALTAVLFIAVRLGSYVSLVRELDKQVMVYQWEVA